jgi:phosphoglycolate phosphatase
MTEITERYEHIIWDWNGTLLDDTGFCVTIINRMLSGRGLPETNAEYYRSVFSFPAMTIYKYLGFDLVKESFETIGREFFLAYESERHTCALQPGARSLLEYVDSTALSQSLLSAYAQETLDTIVDAFDLRHFFAHLVGVDHIYATGKVEQGRHLMELLPYKADRILLVGDTLHDLDVAEAMGTDCVLIAHGHQTRQRLVASGATVVDRFEELYPLISR